MKRAKQQLATNINQRATKACHECYAVMSCSLLFTFYTNTHSFQGLLECAVTQNILIILLYILARHAYLHCNATWKTKKKKYIVLSCYIYIRLHVSSMYTCTVTRKSLSPSAVDKILFCSSAVAILFNRKKNHKGSQVFHRCLYSFIIKRSGWVLLESCDTLISRWLLLP